MKLPNCVYQRLLKQSRSCKEEEFGELRLDASECLIVTRDADERRVSLKLEVTQSGQSLACVVESSSGSLKVKEIVDTKVNCLPKHYKVAETVKEGFKRPDAA